MKRHRKAMVAMVAVVLLVVSVVAAANAQNARRNLQIQRQGAKQKVMLRLRAFLGGLDLTQQQKDQVKTILAGHKSDIQAVARQNVQDRLALRNAIVGGATDDSALKAAFDRVKDDEWNAVTLRTKMTAEIKQILTPDQQARLQQRIGKVDTRIQNRLNRIGK
jgi:Spy/CpxP family protein refolding chaperone